MLEETKKHEVLPDPSLGQENGAQASWILESTVLLSQSPVHLPSF